MRASEIDHVTSNVRAVRFSNAPYGSSMMKPIPSVMLRLARPRMTNRSPRRSSCWRIHTVVSPVRTESSSAASALLSGPSSTSSSWNSPPSAAHAANTQTNKLAKRICCAALQGLCVWWGFQAVENR
ncbi:MAG: hypothetical protein QM765_25645 [Myxococcales bacterium]